MFYCYYYAGKGQGKAWIQRLTQHMVQVEDSQGLLVNTASMKSFNNDTVFFECVIIHSSS